MAMAMILKMDLPAGEPWPNNKRVSTIYTRGSRIEPTATLFIFSFKIQIENPKAEFTSLINYLNLT